MADVARYKKELKCPGCGPFEADKCPFESEATTVPATEAATKGEGPSNAAPKYATFMMQYLGIVHHTLFVVG